jgi:hypothetical protein
MVLSMFKKAFKVLYSGFSLNKRFMVKTLQRGAKYVLLYLASISLFFAPMYKPFSDELTSLHSFLLAIYWCILTIISIAIGLKVLDKMLRGVDK